MIAWLSPLPILGCSQEVAEAVIEMRPYAGPGDIRTKLRKRKGVSGNLFDNYVELMLVRMIVRSVRTFG